MISPIPGCVAGLECGDEQAMISPFKGSQSYQGNRQVNKLPTRAVAKPSCPSAGTFRTGGGGGEAQGAGRSERASVRWTSVGLRSLIDHRDFL